MLAVSSSVSLSFKYRPTTFSFFTVSPVSVSLFTHHPLHCASVCWHRLFQSCYAGPEDGPGGTGRAGEVESPQCVEDHVGQRCHVDPRGFPVVHLSLHWRLASGGESLVALTKMFILIKLWGRLSFFILEIFICRFKKKIRILVGFSRIENLILILLFRAPQGAHVLVCKSLSLLGERCRLPCLASQVPVVLFHNEALFLIWDMYL